jgi:hypothetical protein
MWELLKQVWAWVAYDVEDLFEIDFEEDCIPHTLLEDL